MAKAKTPANTVELAEMPEPLSASADNGGDSIQTVTFDDHKDQMNAVSKGGGIVDLSKLDLSEEDSKDDFGFMTKIPSHRFVVAKLVSSPGSPWNDLSQKSNGMRATFKKDKWMVVQYFHVKNAEQSGYTDWENHKGSKHMRRVENRPVFDVQDKIPDDMNHPSKIMEFIEDVYQQSKRRLPLACDTFLNPPKPTEPTEEK